MGATEPELGVMIIEKSIQYKSQHKRYGTFDLSFKVQDFESVSEVVELLGEQKVLDVINWERLYRLKCRLRQVAAEEKDASVLDWHKHVQDIVDDWYVK